MLSQELPLKVNVPVPDIIIIINTAGILAGFAGIFLIIKAIIRKRLVWQSGIFLLIPVLVLIFVFTANVFEYEHLYINMDQYEEYLELLIIPALLIFLYSLVTEEVLKEKVKREQELERMVKERNLFIQELQHRIKNNLQLISSFINLQIGNSDKREIMDALGAAVNRIDSLGVVQNVLYDIDDFSNIRIESCFGEVIRNLVGYFEIDTRETLVELSDRGITAGMDTVVSCCVIINELVSNIFRHVKSHVERCVIKIDVDQSSDGMLIIGLSDNGPGLSENISFEKTPGLGLLIVDVVTQQIGGTVEILRGSGTEFRFKIPAETKKVIEK